MDEAFAKRGLNPLPIGFYKETKMTKEEIKEKLFDLAQIYRDLLENFTICDHRNAWIKEIKESVERWNKTIDELNNLIEQ